MNRRPLIAGNWKMHLTVAEAVRLAQAAAAASGACPDRDVMVAPAFTALAKVCEAVGDTPLQVAAQNVAWDKEGAYTGEISALMLTDLGVRLAIVGHSERRQIFGEIDAMINRRLLGALAGGLQPVLCVGETLEERESNRTFSVLERQMRQGLQGVAKEEMFRLVLAYEPVWAIGTGKTATKEQAQEVHAFLRQFLADAYEKNIADAVRILYGGSVKPENIDSLMAQPDIDGALVGGAALNAESFDRIIRFQ
ncbi:triose-phosphate isomerase [Desulfobulbus sp.]|uniref:triose-phosphate isomerase n=1 Tax=Desulfobulbus sp. TaxID=895 RepID=UPI00286F78EB|nr:triose-phosphate isomerase [Desulfobulbus sp.]